jgi:hypothetical protein
MHAREGVCQGEPRKEGKCSRINKPSKWMKVTNMKVTVEDNHAETMAGYKLAAEDTSTSMHRIQSHTKFQSQPQVSHSLVSVPALLISS